MSLTACIKKAAKAISPQDGNYLVQVRAELMQEGMTAIEADRAAIQTLLDDNMNELKDLSMMVEEQGGKPLYQEMTQASLSRVTDRTPELQEAAQGVAEGTVDQEQYAETVDQFKPVQAYESVPEPEADDAAVAALTEDKRERFGAAREVEDGTPVAVRLDIPAYRDNGTWVVSIHEQKEGKGQSSFQAGKSIGYDSTAVIDDVEFGMPQKGALNIAKGKPKGTIATMKGTWRNVSAVEAKEMADAAMASGDYVQVGMDPERHSFFYDRGDHRVPVLSAEEVIQVGPLVLAKNPTYGKKEDFLFSRTGKPALDPVQLNAVVERITPGRNIDNPDSPVVVVDTFNDLPQAIKEVAIAQGAQRADGTSEVDGAFHNGKVYLVREEIASEEQAETVLLHETTHGGMMEMLRDQGIKQAANDLFVAIGGSKGFNKIATEMGIEEKLKPYREGSEGMTQEDRQFLMVSEMLAYIGEKGSKGLKLKAQELIGRIKQWLRDRGFATLAEKDATDIAYMARKSREIGLGEGPATLFSRKREKQLGEYAAFQDANGGLFVKGDVEAIRSKLPEGLRGRPVEGGLQFTPNKAPKVEAALSGERFSGRSGEVTKNEMKNGRYVGAPPQYNTPAKLPSFRKRFKGLAEEGTRGRFWYENSGEAILQMTGGNVEEAKKFVALLAIFSPQAKVDANSTFALRAWAQYQAGKPIDVKQENMNQKATELLYEDKPWNGEKTSNFFQNLLREIEPSTEGKQGATIDLWMMRAGGFKTDAPNGSQYAFLENETNRLAQELGWEPQQVQAAIWVAMKARMENKGVKQRTEARSEKDGYLHYTYEPKKTRHVTSPDEHMQNWIDEAMKHTPTEADTSAAKFDYGDGVRRHLGQISWEATPSTKIDVLPGIHDASYEDKLDFQYAVQNVLYDENGTDKLAMQLGLLVNTNDTVVPGYWEGISNPSNQTEVAMVPAKGSATATDQAQKDSLDVYAAALGLMLNQDGVGYHRPFYKAAKKDSHGIELDVGGPLTGDQVTALGKGIETVFGDLAGAIGIISTPNGVRLVDFSEMGYKKFGPLIQQVVESETDISAELVHFAFDGDLVENNWEDSADGQDYINKIRDKGRSDILGFIAAEFSQPLQEVYNRYSEEFGWGEPGNVEERLEQASNEAGYVTPLFSRRRESTFTVPEEKFADMLIRNVQDKFLQVQRVQRAIQKATGRVLEKASDPYLLEQFFTGKAEEDLNKIERVMIKPMMDLLGKYDLTLNELDLFLMARHAPERNATIAERRTPKETKENPNPESDMPDGGSGMTNQQAADWIAAFDREGKLQQLEEVAVYVDKMVTEQRRIMGDLDLINEGQRYQLENNWKFYVPLKGFAEDAESDGSTLHQKRGKGFDIRGKEYKAATGRNSMPESPTTVLLSDLTEKIIRSRKNEVGQAFLKMVQDNPNPDMYEILQPGDLPKGYDGTLDKDGKAVLSAINPAMDPSVLAVKQGGETKYIKIHDPLLAKAMKNMGPTEMGKVTQLVNTATRFLAAANTSFSPEFPPVNFVRDITTAIMNVLAESDLKDGKIKDIEGVAKKMAKGALGRIKTINSYYESINNDPKYVPEGAEADYAEFLAMGAKTGYFDSKDIEQLKGDLDSMLSMAGNTNKGAFLRAKKKVFDKVEQWNTAVENGVRLSAYIHARDAVYKAALDAGVPSDKAMEDAKLTAADLAKNLTVNFNRKGEYGQAVNAWYMFANASIQGSFNLLRAVSPLRRDIDGDFKLDPKMNTAQKVAAGMVGTGYFFAAMNREHGGEDEDGVPYWDKIPRHVRERNLILLDSVWGGDPKKYLAIPLPYGFNIFFNVGDTVEAARNSEYLPRRQSLGGQLVIGALNSFSPFGVPAGEDALTGTALTLTPSVLKPIAEIAANQSEFSGGPIYPEQRGFGAQPVESYQSFRSTKEVYKNLAMFMNDFTGGSKYEEGGINIAPDKIEHVVEYALGGMYRTGSRLLETVDALGDGRELSINNIPYARSFAGENRFYEDQSLFYDRLEEIDNAVAAIKDRESSPAERGEARKTNMWKIKLANRAKASRKIMKFHRDARDRIVANTKLTDAEKDLRIKDAEAKMKAATDEFNKSFNEAQKAAGE